MAFLCNLLSSFSSATFFFFFQAEDGIRDGTVTGVQTCALPISEEVLHQLELFLMRAPATLRFVLATRHDLRLGLHRLRLDGDLTEIRAADLRFTSADSRALFEAAGVKLPDAALGMLLERPEGWAAGLRLAALSLQGQADPQEFASE